ncbi:MAG: energy transducer TonB [Bacteroidia bacterium]|nr:energy transducer TonB [Bacteroidia bacterium]
MKTKFIFIITFLFSLCAFSQTKPDSTKKASNTHNSIKDVKKFPEFPGGQQKLKEFVYANLQKPKDSTPGKIYTRFTVLADGQVTNPVIIKGLNKNCDKAVIEVINKLPKFNPALDRTDNPVVCDLFLPVEIN